ncbi:MAG: ACP S-malonyltransferase [Chloroflexaceae bacterium]|jgi:[acyl-carrier-protein] S-malonyltransferase|nr:ACP S-malonyltransferase [Chloroflexaceae bacterium]
MTVALVFPGQGSQAIGMGRDLYQSLPEAREIFEQADAELDVSVSRLCFEGPEETLTATENAQPALLTVSVALLTAMYVFSEGRRFSNPLAVAGHSLGEYSALVAGGALDFVSALRLVRRRGELMAEAQEGTMAAIIGMEEATLDQVCRDVSAKLQPEAAEPPVVIANYNAPGQLVISGSVVAVEQACALAKERGAKRAMPLKVSAAFHSPLMARAAEGMARALHNVHVTDLKVPLIANVTARPLMTAAEVRDELVTQVVAPVRWIASVRQMVAEGVHHFVEIGPGKVLNGLIKRIAPEATVVSLNTVDDIKAFVSEQR